MEKEYVWGELRRKDGGQCLLLTRIGPKAIIQKILVNAARSIADGVKAELVNANKERIEISLCGDKGVTV
jgi:hypothetical protein